MGEGIQGLAKRLKKIELSRLFIRNLLLLSIIVMLPMGIVVWISGYSFNALIQNEIILYSNKSMAMIKNTTDSMLYDCLRQMNYLSGDNDINTFLISNPDDEVFFFDINRMFNQIETQMQSKDYLESIMVYSDINNMLLSNYGLTKFENFIDTSWYDEYMKNRKMGSFWVAYRDIVTPSGQQHRILTLFKSLGFSGKYQGVIIFNINFNRFVQELSSLRSSYDYGLYLIDDDLNPLTTIWGSIDALSPDEIYTLMNSETDYMESEKFVMYKAPVRYTDLSYISAVPKEIYQSNINSMRSNMQKVILSGFAFTMLITILITIRLYIPYKKILSAIKGPVTFLPQENEKINRNEETYILNTIKSAINKNIQITQQLDERITMLKRAQSIALQSQINPHFLYNTLDTINWSAMRLTGGKNETSSMITNLASMIRYSLESVDTLVSFEKELSHARTYLDLQEIRYKDKFKVQWYIDESVKKCSVIKILLQPLLENAIYHGIRPLNDSGIIYIKAGRSNNDLSIIVEDNGAGMDSNKINQINEMLRDEKIQESEHIGIMNVNLRIRLFFGDEYGIVISPAPVRGVSVNVTMPLIFS